MMKRAESKVRPLPAGGLTLPLAGNDGWPLRAMMWSPQKAHATILLLGGRGDFIEKYAELIEDLLARDFAVATMDWRGQGLSGEMTLPPRRTHISDFGVWLDDAQQFTDQLVKSKCIEPLYLLAHSMGGHLALRLMHELPGRFERATLLAPMLGLQTHPFSTKFVWALATLAVRTGQGERFGFGQLPYGPYFNSAIRMNRLTSDKARFAQESAAIALNPALAIGGVTYAWLAAAFQSCALLASPGYAERIATPTLFLTAAREMLVDNDATQAFAARMPQAQYELIADGRHELFRESDPVRQIALGKLFDFFQSPAK